MLRITNHSENYSGIISVDDTDIASVDGTVNQDNVYMNFNGYNGNAIKADKDTVCTDVAEFLDTILEGEQAE